MKESGTASAQGVYLITRWERQLVEQGRAERTCQDYAVALLGFWASIPDKMDAREITEEDITRFLSKPELVENPAARILHAQAVRRFFSWAEREGFRKGNPAEHIPT